MYILLSLYNLYSYRYIFLFNMPSCIYIMLAL
nr:MAG TPA: hypothetical protein [Caudoviricetes sp.]